jgi:hypothetical protein
VGVQDAPTTDVLFIVLDTDLPRPGIHRSLLPTHHPRSLQGPSTGWKEEEEEEVRILGEGLL